MGRAAGASLARGGAGGHYLATTRARKARHQCCMSHHQGLRIAKSAVGARRPRPGRGPPVAWFVELAVVEQQAKNNTYAGRGRFDFTRGHDDTRDHD